MLPWIRGWGADVEVLEPRELREKMMGEARRLAETYSWQVGHPGATDEHDSLLSTFNDFFGG